MNNMVIYGGVVFGDKVYENIEILMLVGKDVGTFSMNCKRKPGRGNYEMLGAGWCFVGDCGTEEASIAIEVGTEDFIFEGETALPEALAFLATIT